MYSICRGIEILRLESPCDTMLAMPSHACWLQWLHVNTCYILYTVDYMCLKKLKRHNMQVLTVLRICEHRNKASLQSPSPWSWGAVSIISRPLAAVAALTNPKLQRAAGAVPKGNGAGVMAMIHDWIPLRRRAPSWEQVEVLLYSYVRPIFVGKYIVWMFCSHLDLEHVWTYHAFRGAHFLPTRRFW